MGNYNCQECFTKETNAINELLIDKNILGNNSKIQNNSINTRYSKLKDLKANNEEIKKAIEEANLSYEQKILYEKMINDNSNQFLNQNKQNNIINEYKYNKNIQAKKKKVEPPSKKRLNSQEEEQKKIIQIQQEQILEQQKIIEQYKQQQLLLLQEQNQLKAEEEELKKHIKKFKKKDIQNIKEIKIQSEESHKIDNQRNKSVNKMIMKKSSSLDKNKIKKSESYEKNKGIINQEQKTKNKLEIQNQKSQNIENIQINPTQKKNQEEFYLKEENNNIHENYIEEQIQQEERNQEELQYQEHEQQKEVEENQLQEEQIQEHEEQFEHNLDVNPGQQEIEGEENNEQPLNQDEEINDDQIDKNIENEFLERMRNIGLDLPMMYQSQKFKVETYEPIDPKNESDIENENDDVNEGSNNENKDNKNIELIDQLDLVPRDSIRKETKIPILTQTNNVINVNYSQKININNNMKINLNENEPKDSLIKDKVSFEFNSNNSIKKINSKESIPKDSNRRVTQKNTSNEKYNNKSKNGSQKKQKREIPLNTNEVKELNEMAYKNQEINIFNNLNQIYGNSNNNKIQLKLVNKQALPLDSFQKIQNQNEAYFYQQQKINLNQRYSPNFNKMNDEALNSNMKNLENFDKDSRQITSEEQIERRAVTLGPYLNSVEEINNAYSTTPIINQRDNQEKTNNNYMETNQMSSVKEFDITSSDRNNSLFNSNEKGNMHY